MEIRLEKVSKIYPLKTALEGVSVTFESAKIHALLGENGAGKSTLAKIISGRIKMTSGCLFINGEPAFFSSPRDALKKGIVEVQQRPLLSYSLTAKQNILLSHKSFSSNGGKEFNAKLLALKNKWAPSLDINAKIKDLALSGQFYTGLLCALVKDFECLILDEPSAFLSFDERKELFSHLKEICKNGKTIILITHSRTEALNYADSITLLQKGKLSAFYKEPSLYKKLVESSISFSSYSERQSAIPKSSERAKKTLCIRFTNTSCSPNKKPCIKDINLCANYGEITAVSSGDDPSFPTLEDFLTGMSQSKCSGKVEFFEKIEQPPICISAKKYRASFLRDKGIAVVPSDKTFRASNPELTVGQILTVFEGNASALIKKAGVSIGKNEKCSSLSGGMLQRLVLERELSANPLLVILCNPMAGLDVNAQAGLCRRIESLTEEGVAILILGAQDFPMTLCSKVYSLNNGNLSLSFSKEGL